MKKSSKIMLGVAAAMAFTACSTDEVVNPAASGDITVSVQTGGTMSRAIETVEGYDLKCTMQLLDDQNATVGTNATVAADGGVATFTISGTDIDAGATKALFWAEYVPTTDGKKVYNSENLTNITYNVVEFDATTMAAADAFAGTITDLSNGATATLTRPLIKMNFTPKNPENAEGYSNLVVAYKAYSGFNVLTKNCTESEAQEVTYTDAEFNPEETWFTGYLFAPANESTFGNEMTMTLSGTGKDDRDVIIKGGNILLSQNNIVNVEGDLSTSDMDVTVTIDGIYDNEPKPEEPAKFEVGAYVDAAGVPTKKVEEAVAIIFSTEALNGDVIDNYPTEYAGKEIAGYAVALENTAATRQAINTENITDLTQTSFTNGTQNTENLLNNAGIKDNAFAKAFNTFVTNHTLTAEGTTTTGWYIPVQTQLTAWISMLFTVGSAEATGTDAFKALFPMTNLYDRYNADTDSFNGNGAVMYASCSINQNGNISGFTLAEDKTAKDGQITVSNKTGQAALCRPMITIFK